ncbi:hypothetical protein LT85_2168 [Collimonas arenae]|uniref:Uncharacterized protein n=1 Tax=Collimonas arenae TaxID=279058 RepID=A0A0A1F9Z7_9BURK|nr:hypothetical protein LT85_2168 [Collimonas arenae]
MAVGIDIHKANYIACRHNAAMRVICKPCFNPSTNLSEKR